MSNLLEMKQTVLELSLTVKKEMRNGNDPNFMLAAANACREAAAAYAIMREVELHEEYHKNNTVLPGENFIPGH